VRDAEVNNVDHSVFVDRDQRRPAVNSIGARDPPVGVWQQEKAKVLLATDLGHTLGSFAVSDRQDHWSSGFSVVRGLLQATQFREAR
jgi:hypothetical protein